MDIFVCPSLLYCTKFFLCLICYINLSTCGFNREKVRGREMIAKVEI